MQEQADLPLDQALARQQTLFRAPSFGFNRNSAPPPAPAKAELPASLRAAGFQDSDLPYLKQSDLQTALRAAGQSSVMSPVGVIGFPRMGLINSQRQGVSAEEMEAAKNSLAKRLAEMNTRRDTEAKAAAKQAGVNQLIADYKNPLGSLTSNEAGSIYDLQKQGYSFDQARKKTVKDLYGIDEDLT